MANDGSVIISAVLETDEVSKGVKKVQADLAKLSVASADASKKSNKSFSEFLNNIQTSTVATFAAVGGAIKLFTNSLNSLGRIDDMSQKLGMSRGEFQRWDYVTKQSGVQIEQLSIAMKTLADNAVGNSAAFKKLGISAKDANGNFKSQEQLFNESVAALAKMPPGIERTTLSTDLFGRSAMDLATILNLTNEELEKMRGDAPVFSDDEIKAGDQLGDALQSIRDNLQALTTSAILPLISALVPVFDELRDMTKQGSDLNAVFKGLGEILSFVVTALKPFLEVLKLLMPILKTVVSDIVGLVSGVRDLGEAVGVFKKDDPFENWDKKNNVEKITTNIKYLKDLIAEQEGRTQGLRQFFPSNLFNQSELDAAIVKNKALLAQQEEMLKTANAKGAGGSGTVGADLTTLRLLESKFDTLKAKITDTKLKARTGGWVDMAQLASDEEKLAGIQKQIETLKDEGEKSIDISETIQTAWASAMKAMGDAIMNTTAMLVSGTASFNDVLQGIVENMASVLDAIGDAMITQGTALSIASALSPGALIAGGFMVKAFVGVVKGLIARSQAGKYADGGIVPGTSFAGDNVPALVNSGELILNKAQQNNLAGQLSNNGGVNIQIINKADVDITTTKDNTGKQITMLITQQVETFMTSKRGMNMVKDATMSNGK